MNDSTERLEYKTDYDLKEIFSRATQGVEKRIVGKRREDLTDGIVRQLPFVSREISNSKTNLSFDIADDSFDSKEDGGRLILRIGVKKKTWYVIPARRNNKRTAASIRIGEWTLKESGYYTDGEANVKTARDRFKAVIKDYFNESVVASKKGDMTIREYLESGQYKIYRTIKPIENGKMKPVEDKVIKSILSQFEQWLDEPLTNVNEAWPAAFKKYWDERYEEENKRGARDPNYVEKKVDQGTQRRYFTQIQAMFSIAEKMGYISRNWLKGGTSLFPKKKKPRGSTTTYKFAYEDLFNFIYNDAEKGTVNGKLIICIMAVTACRNSEVYKNLKENLEFHEAENGNPEYFTLEIPAWLCKTRESGAGIVAIKHSFVVKKLKEHLQKEDVINSLYILPSPTINKHCSDDAYRELWQEIKVAFNLKKKDRLYSLRATLATRIVKESGPEVASHLLREDIVTTMENYVDDERKNEALDKVFNGNNQNKNEAQQSASILATETEELVLESDDGIPVPILMFWNAFKNGKIVT